MDQKDIKKLLDWYQINKRDLVWRKTNDPYKIWISEVMLQQTRVEVVKDYYVRFIQVFPTIYDLANAKEEELLKLWEGLGYYSRAKNLKKCAEIIIQNGYDTFPSQINFIEKLPGIGPYTAGAILSIAYQECYPALDGNVLRILSRIFEDHRNMNKESVKIEYRKLLAPLMKKKYARDFTEGFIELGALICLPNGLPNCLSCPFQNKCKSYKHHSMLNYPIKKKKNQRKIIEKTVYVLKYKDKYFISKRQNGVLSGLYEFPNIDKVMGEKELKEYLKEKNYSVSSIQNLGKFKHIFSHLEWHMTAYLIELKKIENPRKFYTKQKIEQKYSLPTAFYKIFQKLN